MPTEEIPYPNAKTLFDILTDDQKKALKRMESEHMLSLFERGKPDRASDDEWDHIMTVNIGRIKALFDENVFIGEWQERAAAFLEANKKYLTQASELTPPTT